MIKQLIKKELGLLNDKAVSYCRYKQGRITYAMFVVQYMNYDDRSLLEAPREFVLDWLMEQKDNDLPITSSGSTLNGILDEDQFINLLEGNDVRLENEILSYECKDYIAEEIDAIRTRFLSHNIKK